MRRQTCAGRAYRETGARALPDERVTVSASALKFFVLFLGLPFQMLKSFLWSSSGTFM
jgi:hypothetical protein